MIILQTSSLPPGRQRLWKIHKYRGDYDFCPLCFSPIRWVKLDEGFTPCGREPVLYYGDTAGKYDVVPRFGRAFIRASVPGIFGEKSISANNPLRMGSLPHIYVCRVLRKERYEYARLLSLEREMPPK